MINRWLFVGALMSILPWGSVFERKGLIVQAVGVAILLANPWRGVSR